MEGESEGDNRLSSTETNNTQNEPLTTPTSDQTSIDSDNGSNSSSKEEKEHVDNPLALELGQFLKDRSQLYKGLAELKEKTRKRKEVDDYFEREKEREKEEGYWRKQFQVSKKIMEQIEKRTNVISQLNSKLRNALSVYGSPGGHIQVVLSRAKNSSSKAVGYDLPPSGGGIEPLISKKEKRYSTTYVDITHNIPQPPKGLYELVLLLGWDYKSSLGAKILILSELILAFGHISHGGSLVLLLSHKEDPFYASVIYILSSTFDSVELQKPSASDQLGSNFFVIAKGLQSRESIPQLKKWLQELKQGKDLETLTSISNLISKFGSRLVDLYTPLWETQKKAMEKILGPLRPLPPGKKFTMQANDNKGVLFHLTGGDPRDPQSPVTVTSSGNSVGEPVDFISHAQTRCWTRHLPYSWFSVDLGPEHRVIPSHYSLGYASSGSACCPRYWLLQGSNDLSQSKLDVSPINDSAWTTLSIHSNDTSLKSEWQIHSWRLHTKEAFRHFRILQTGPNSFNARGGEDNWSQVLVANRFEIYGVLLDSQTEIPQEKTLPLRYGSSGKPPKTMEIIRANPSVTREIQELLVAILRSESESPARVRVHDIL